jgi:predicted amidohydrolase YtcJ
LKIFRLVMPFLLIFIFTCTLPGISPTITDTPAASATETGIIPAHSPDAIFYNGIILAMDDNQPQAQAIAIEGERILAVGTNDEILALKDSSTQVFDLQGKTVMPGFIDSHSHRLTQRYKWGFSTLQEAVTEALSQGWTGVDELAIDQSQLQELIALDAQGGLRSRVNVYLMVNTFEGNSLGDWFRAYQPGQQISPFLRIAGLKIFIDYDSGRKLLFQQTELNELVRQLQTEGWTISVKAISIQSHELALNAFEYTLNGESNDLHRHRIEHSIAASDEQVDRMARLGIIVCIQPSLPGVTSFDPDTYKMRDENGAANVWRWSDYLNGGVFMIASPLNPYPDVEEHLSPTHISPMGLLYRSVTKIGVGGQQPPEWMLEKSLTVEQILPLLTINGAYATFDEDVKGSLTPGKYADLVILSDNPLDTSVDGLLGIQTMMTMVGGRVEYCAARQEWLCPGRQEATPASSRATETPLATPFTGTWQGTDPFDSSIITLSLAQSETDLAGTYKDTFSPNVDPPGYEGRGAGNVLSGTTAEMTFELVRWDGKSVQAQYSLTLSDQNSTLTLCCDVGNPIVLQRQ